MNRKILQGVAILATLLIPSLLNAQSTGGVQQLHQVLENLYSNMVKISAGLIDVARAIAGFGALFYIGFRVWRHIAHAEAIDFFPLFKPFVVAGLLTIYPVVLNVMNGILKPMVISTAQLVNDSQEAVNNLLKAKAESIMSDNDWESLGGSGLGYNDTKDWYKYEQPQQNESSGTSFGQVLLFPLKLVTNAIKLLVKMLLSVILQVLFYAASLCIDTMRTFHLIILAILGPFVLCLSIFDGFQHTLPVWLGRYINVYLWLPIANLFGAMINRIQQGMLQLDLSTSGSSIGFSTTDIAYLIFLVIAIIGYFTVPSIANYVVHASGASTLLSKTNRLVLGGASAIMSGSGGGGASAAGGSMAADIMGNDKKMSSMADAANSEPYMKDGNEYQRNKLSGNA